jgi:NAD(P)-dependent dehydrogenase (short-subunit alcohol dehydrogenase family)
MDVRGKVALITGATGDLGRVVTKNFVQHGALVAATYRDKSRLSSLQRSLGRHRSELFPVACDLTKGRQVHKAVQQVTEKFGRLDVLLCLAGGYLGGVPVAQMTEKDWDGMFQLNVKSAFLCCRAALPTMIAQDSGRIVCVSSRGAVQSWGGDSAYSASKASVVKLVESLDRELRSYYINVNAVLPSIIDTAANRRAMPNADFSTWVKAEELANVLLFLASDASSGIRGAAIPVYGRA